MLVILPFPLVTGLTESILVPYILTLHICWLRYLHLDSIEMLCLMNNVPVPDHCLPFTFNLTSSCFNQLQAVVVLNNSFSSMALLTTW